MPNLCLRCGNRLSNGHINTVSSLLPIGGNTEATIRKYGVNAVGIENLVTGG